MKKLAVKIISAFLFVLSVGLFAACADEVSLKEGAVVNLTVVTDEETYDVTSSYGEITCSGNVYTVTVDVKKDFMISVSAEGLVTQNVPVTVADLASGSCNKSVELKEEIAKEVQISVSGDVENIKVTCDGVDLPLTRGAYTGMLTPTQIRTGFKVEADNAVPRTLTFTDDQLQGTIIKAETFLVQPGYKVVELRGDYDRKYLVDADNRLVPLTKIREQTNVYGTADGFRVILDSDYEGVLYLKNYSSGFGMQYDTAITIEKDFPTYGTVIDFVDTTNIDKFTDLILDNFSPSGTGEDFVYVEFESEKERRLERYLVRQGGHNTVNVYYVSIIQRVSDPSRINAVWEISENGAKYATYQGEGRIDCSAMQSVEFGNFICLYDQNFKEVRTDVSEVYYQKEWEYTPVPLTNGTAVYDTELYGKMVYVKADEQYKHCDHIVDLEYRYRFIFANGQWCIPISYNHEVTYRIALNDKEGNPITGAVIASSYDSFEAPDFESGFTETAPGIYTPKENVSFSTGNSYFVKYGNTIDLLALDGASWERDGYTLKTSVKFDDPQFYGFNFKTDIPSLWKYEGDRTCTFEVLTDGVELYDISYLNQSEFCYVRAPYRGTVQIKVTLSVYYTLTKANVYEQIVTIPMHDVWGKNVYVIEFAEDEQ